MKVSLRQGVCKGCGKDTIIQNKVRYLCKDCVYKLNHAGKTPAQVQQERQRERSLDKPNPIKPRRYIYKRRDTGEKQIFLEIWNERQHQCENCGASLGNIPKNYMFSHIVAKGVNSKLRLDKSNIKLLCWDCHYALDFRGKEHYDQRKNNFGK